MDSHELRLEVEALRHLADTQPPIVRDVFHWALAMVMVETGRGRIVEQHTTDRREHCTFASPEGDAVSLLKPDVSEAVLDQMMAAVRATVEEEFRRMEQPDHAGLQASN